MAKQKSQKLAIHGGERTVPKDLMKPWPPVDDVDRQMVMASLEAGTFTIGANYKALDVEFAEWAGLEHAVFCNSGTAALHMALVACGCGCGDEVIAPAYTWPSSATCCLHHNIIPVFVDIDWTTMNIDVEKIEAAITPRTKAIIAVHLHGLMVDMAAVMAIAEKHNLMVIEDCCQAHGATFRGRRAGSFGHCAAFSNNQNKLHCSGEGGFFASNDKKLFDRGKTLWYFGEHRPPEAGDAFFAYSMGWMYRSTELTAALARAQLTKLSGYLEQVRANALHLEKCLADVPNLILPEVPDGHVPNYYNYTIRFDMDALGHAADAPVFRDKLVKALTAEGVDTGVWQGWPVPEMTAIAAKNAYGRGCPWSCTESTVDYSLDQFPVAVKHCGWHTGMTMPLRPPNGPDVAEVVAEGWRKVMTNTDQVEAVELPAKAE
jgi:dTDP-4-amino-4,6-dideoxygalactose transaminase